MKSKLLEIRDEGTLIFALCVDMNPNTEFQGHALRRYGYPCDGRPNIVVDVSFILKETSQPKTSEIICPADAFTPGSI